MNDANERPAFPSSATESELYGHLIEAGKAGRTEHAPEVALFLDSPSPLLRSAAIRVLGFYWALPAYRERAAEMVLHDPDDDTRDVAIMTWSHYHASSRDAAVLSTLFSIGLGESESFRVRWAAYVGMLVVAGLHRSELAHAPLHGNLDESIDWDLVRRALDGTGIEVPARQSTVVARLGVTRFIYENGSEYGLDRIGRIILTLDGQFGFVELVHRKHGNVRAWHADLPLDTWKNLLEILERTGFPRPPVNPPPQVPGMVTTTMTWTRREHSERVHVPGGVRDYADVNRFAYSIVAQVGPHIVPGTETVPPVPRSYVEHVREEPAPSVT